jgi:hypothetical protein
MPAYKTIDQEFEDSYAEKGLQPSVGHSTPIRNVKVTRKINSNEYDRQNNTKGATDDRSFNTSKAANDDNFKPRQKNSPSQTTARVTSQQPRSAGFTRRVSGFTSSQTTKEEASQTVLSSASTSIAKLKANALTPFVISYCMGLWFVQFIFAIISLVMLGAMGALEQISQMNVITRLATKFGDKLAAGIKQVFGVDLNIMHMSAELFTISYSIVYAVGIATLLGAFFIYIFSGLRPLSGQQAGLKIGLFLFALTSYFIPLLNLFPCFLLWVMAVRKYPK